MVILSTYKSDIYIMVGHHEEPNVYYIQLFNSDKKGLPKVVNRCQLFNLNCSSPPPMTNSFDGDCANVPSFLHPSNPSKSSIDFDSSVKQAHHYNTRQKCKATTTSRQVVAGNNHYSFIIVSHKVSSFYVMLFPMLFMIFCVVRQTRLVHTDFYHCIVNPRSPRVRRFKSGIGVLPGVQPFSREVKCA